MEAVTFTKKFDFTFQYVFVSSVTAQSFIQIIGKAPIPIVESSSST